MRTYCAAVFMLLILFFSFSQVSFSDSIQVHNIRYDDVYVQKTPSHYIIYNPKNAKIIKVSNRRFDVKVLKISGDEERASLMKSFEDNKSFNKVSKNKTASRKQIINRSNIDNKKVPVLKDKEPSTLAARRAAWAVRDVQMQVYRQQQQEEYLQRKEIEDAEKAKQEKKIQAEQKNIMEYQQELQKEYDKEIIRQQVDIELQNRAAIMQGKLNRQMINEMRYQEEQNRRHYEQQVDRLLKKH